MTFINSVKSITRYIWQSPSNKGQKCYRITLAILWQFYKRIVGLPLISTLDNGAKFILEPNSTNSTGNIYVKTYEAEYVYFLRKHILKGGLIIDVGAHMGLYTLLLHDLFDGGYCFEPAKDTFRALKSNFFINDIIEKFIPVNSAVSDTNENQMLKIQGIYSGVNHLVSTIEEDSGQAVVVPTVSIDNYLVNKNEIRKIQFIKIDTEGHELKVVQGCLHTLRRNPYAIVLIENSAPVMLMELFSSLNFRVFSIDKHGNIVFDKNSILSAYNIFAVGWENPLFAKINSIF
jgi:FkbM family methyltransferase